MTRRIRLMVEQLELLERIHKLVEFRNLKILSSCRNEMRQAENRYQQTCNEIVSLETELGDTVNYVWKNISSMQSVDYLRIQNRRYWIQYDYEKLNFYIDQERETLDVARQKYQEAKKQFNSLHEKSNRLNDLKNKLSKRFRVYMENAREDSIQFSREFDSETRR